MTVVQSYRKIAQVLQSDAKTNIEIDIKSVDYIRLLKYCLHGCNDATSFGQSLAVIQVIHQAYKNMLLIKEGDNNSNVDDLINQLNHTVDVKERHNISNDIIKLSSQDQTVKLLTK